MDEEAAVFSLVVLVGLGVIGRCRETDGREVAMTWTSEKPTCPGYYWLELKHGEPRVVRVTTKTIDSQYGVGCRWAGPITPPEEP